MRKRRVWSEVLRKVVTVAGLMALALPAACKQDEPTPDTGFEVRQAALFCSPTEPPPEVCGATLWPNGRIPYGYDASVGGPETTPGTLQARVRAAMNQWQALSLGRITFELAPTDPQRVVVANTGTNLSDTIGFRPGSGVQTVQLQADGALPHELGHVIGFHHEMKRFDRDRFLFVHPVSPQCSDSQFFTRCVSTDDQSVNWGPYDVDSIMHYGQGAPPSDFERRSGLPVPEFLGITGADGVKIIESYARAYGPWKPSVSLGTNVSATAPLSFTLVPGVQAVVGDRAAVAFSSAMIFLFTRGTDGNLYHRIGTGNGAPNWTAWSPHTAANMADAPAAASVADGQLAVVRKMDGTVSYRVFAETAAFQSLGQPSATVLATLQPAVAVTASGAIYVFVRGSDERLWYRSRQGAAWGAWTVVDGGGTIQGSPAAVSRAGELLDVFGINPGDALAQISWNGQAWSAWTVPGNGSCCVMPESAPAVVAPSSGRLDVFARAQGNILLWKTWTAEAGWTALRPIAGGVNSDPSAAARGSNRLVVTWQGTDYAIWMKEHFTRRGNDITGDRRADLVLFRPSTNSWIVRDANGTTETTTIAPTPPTIVLPPQDFDADGRADLGAIGTGGQVPWSWSILLSGSGTYWYPPHQWNPPAPALKWGVDGDVPLAGDFDGDLSADLAVYRSSNFNWCIRNGTGDTCTVFGSVSQSPAPADYDGDGKTDLATWNFVTRNWRVQSSSSGAALPLVLFGNPGDKPAPGDYDGDGKADLATYRPSDGKLYVKPSLGGASYSVQVGVAGESNVVLLPKDYDGDNVVDAGLYRPVAHRWQWHASSSAPGTIQTADFGQDGDQAF